jgi:hypothetical protein
MALFRNVENAKEVRQNVMNGTFTARDLLKRQNAHAKAR